MRHLRRRITLVFTITFIVIIILRFRNAISDVDDIDYEISNYETNNLTLTIGDFDYWNRYEKWITNYINDIVPGLGELGEPAYSSAGEKNVESKLYSKKGINILVSNRISLKRRLPDVRHLQCRSISYDIEQLPSVSVVVIFHNEPWSVLLRTVHSVLQETAPELLKEIILVDDKSLEEELQGTLSYYVETRLPSKVRLIRLLERQGLIKARLEGAKVASGDVLVFLDAHCEVTKGWLEPMLLRIKEKRNAVVTPFIDVISSQTLEYRLEMNKSIVGGFTWAGIFTWIDIPSRVSRAEESPTSPIETPTIAGGLFAIDRKYFWEIGSYDDKMSGWGGENLEMSFRTWQCGGSLEVIPCSRVGHIFRDFFPYEFPNGSSILVNLARTVNVWMDDYSRFFYLHYDKIEFGDTQDRLELRKQLKCKSFKWYLKNVYPEKFIPDENVRAYGRVRLTNRNLCLEGNDTELKYYTLKLGRCKKDLTYEQFFSLTNIGLLRTEMRCAVILKDPIKVEMNNCEESLEYKIWKLNENGTLVHLPSRLCLDATGLESKQEIKVSPCNGSPDQIWKFDNYPNKS